MRYCQRTLLKPFCIIPRSCSTTPAKRPMRLICSNCTPAVANTSLISAFSSSCSTPCMAWQKDHQSFATRGAGMWLLSMHIEGLSCLSPCSAQPPPPPSHHSTCTGRLPDRAAKSALQSAESAWLWCNHAANLDCDHVTAAVVRHCCSAVVNTPQSSRSLQHKSAVQSLNSNSHQCSMGMNKRWRARAGLQQTKRLSGTTTTSVLQFECNMTNDQGP